MSRHTGKGSHRRKEAALERKATQHHEFIGQAETERAEAEFRKHERLASEQNAETVKEMARELEQAAGLRTDGAMGPEMPLRIPRSIEEGKRMIREAPEAMREKAREKIEKLPEPARKAVDLVGTVAGMAMVPVRLGWNIARDLLQIPFTVLRVLRQREV
ncbi:MAG: hypothetical protein ABR567_18440 [Myxococcales bacterium]|nr:hypothetical protein [Myxococcales bacterium]